MEKLMWVWFFLLAGTCLPANDQNVSSKIFPYEYEVKDLNNGLRIIVIPTDYPNIVSLQIPVQTGSRNEVEPGKSGFAHFFEHMMFRGTDNYSNEEYYAVLKNIGADNNAWTSDDMTNYHTTFSKEDLETVLELEADRFQNLKYAVEDFKTEAKAVLGEYNKNSANPVNKLIEAQQNAAFTTHTYKHTTMGFIEDIMDMPNQYEYSLEFFDRYYKPEKAIIILAGDLEPEKTFNLVEKYWGKWERGAYDAKIPQEPPSNGPVYQHVPWETPTLPWMTVAFHGPAFSETKNDMAVMDVVSQLAFSESSPLYQKLVVQEQKVDQLFPYFPDHIDPYLLTVGARVKDVSDIWYVRDEILKTFASLITESVSQKRLDEIKSNLKYTFANSMDNSETIAGALVGYVARTRDPETINRVYRLYDSITPADIREKAAKYYTDKRLVVATLSKDPLPEIADNAGSIDAIVKSMEQAPPDIRVVLNRGQSPIINFRILFNTGAAHDPAGKEGLARLTASMISQASSESMRYEEIQQALFPMAAGFSDQVDKEMTVFSGTTHKDNLQAFYDIISGQLLSPAWDENDFNRVKTNQINAIKVDLRGNNDEELGKEALYEMIYAGHPYGHLNLGYVSSVEKLTIEDVKSFYRENYTQTNVVLGMAGDFSDAFLNKVKRDLGSLPASGQGKLTLPDVKQPDGFEAQIIEKDTRSTAISFGFPIEVNRSHPDFAALWLVRSYLGEHRSFNGRLMVRMREIRGLNYGDYAYIEYFPRGMFLFHPDPNLGRKQQIFQIWIRPVESIQNAHFATRLAIYELKKLIKEGISKADFEATRNYLLKFANLLTKTQDRQLGYALDSKYYGNEEFTSMISKQLAELGVEDINKVIGKYLQSENIEFVFITKEANALKESLVANTPSPMAYAGEKGQEILDEDRIVEVLPLDFVADKVKIVPVDKVFNTR
jgi:zinc protease